MNRYAIAYDLNNNEKNYNELSKFFNSLTETIHVQKALWIVKSELDKLEFSQKIESILDEDEYYLIFNLDESPNGNVDKNISSKVSEFFKPGG
ncbi:hypothetical protein AB6E71_08525 [Staphylococcus arlettae]|uniref:hypothetical protein n=1 Tax=Staphylococcus TaxID=1279 RepID=UPI0020407CC3|nr:hypothetical protein [Staphylococcus equorum]MCM3071752.1 hypothetical protein [Staphylococcus equorum]